MKKSVLNRATDRTPDGLGVQPRPLPRSMRIAKETKDALRCHVAMLYLRHWVDAYHGSFFLQRME